MHWRREYLRIFLVALLQIIGFSQKMLSKSSKKSLTEKIGCKDERNEDVDWYIIYKLPKIKGKSKKSSYVSGGIDYAYILAPGSKEWTLSEKTVENGSMIEKTLDTYYKDEEDLTYLFYNDDPPGKKSKTAAGHLKGSVVFDGYTGFWLVHSMPNFPDHKQYDYPKAATSHGQTALCITFKTKKLNEIANQLLYSHPNIYAKGITDEVEEQLDDKASSLWSKKPKFRKKAPFQREANLTSLEGTEFISFAKDNQLKKAHNCPTDQIAVDKLEVKPILYSPEVPEKSNNWLIQRNVISWRRQFKSWAKEIANWGANNKGLYIDIIAPTLETSLIVQTWRKGRGAGLEAGKFLSSMCSHKLTQTESEQTVEDVLSINMTLGKGKEHKRFSFKYTKDHSKWAISSDNKNYVCIADLNRMKSQENRGGGALCFKSPDVTDAFDSIIAKTSKSEKKGKRKKKKRRKKKKKSK